MKRTNLKNMDVRVAAKTAGVYLWQIADLWGVSEAYITRALRKELDETSRKRFLDAINEISFNEQALTQTKRK